MSRYILTGWYNDGGSVLRVINHQNTALREMQEMLAKGLTRVHMYEEVRPCTSPDIKQRAREASAALRAQESSSDISLSGLYSWWHSPQGCCCCEEGAT